LNSFQIDLSFHAFVSEYKAALRKFPSFKKDLVATLEQVEKDPRVGDQMQRVGENVFKTRIGIKGQIGKSGGYRLIYHVDWERKVVTPIALYFKPETAKLPDNEVAARFNRLFEAIQAAKQPTPPGSLTN